MSVRVAWCLLAFVAVSAVSPPTRADEADRAEIRKLKEQLQEERDKTRIALTKLAAEIESCKAKGVNLTAELRRRDSEIAELTKKVAELREAAATAEVTRQRIVGHLERLLEDLELLRLKRLPTPPLKIPDPGPAVEAKVLRGKVKAVGADGLVTVPLGSDDGVKKGLVFQVFRTEPKPIYLGTVTIVELTAKESAGRFQPAMRGSQVKEGDLVADRIAPEQ